MRVRTSPGDVEDQTGACQLARGGQGAAQPGRTATAGHGAGLTGHSALISSNRTNRNFPTTTPRELLGTFFAGI